jgi:chloramphenicol 3-O-phosphotransferase
MKHIILYGPPAAGKLSVAEALGKLTGFPLVRNHLANSFVKEVFPFSHPQMARLVINFRTEVIEAAAMARLDGLISTLVYARGTVDDKILKDWSRRISRHGGETLFVRLHCSQRTLFRRIASPGRDDQRQIRSEKQLKGLMRQLDLFTPVAKVASLEIDTDALKPIQAAKLIARHFRLAMKKGR